MQVREELPKWKPNSALVVIDFCLRHGLLDPLSEPGYDELVDALRTRTAIENAESGMESGAR